MCEIPTAELPRSHRYLEGDYYLLGDYDQKNNNCKNTGSYLRFLDPITIYIFHHRQWLWPILL